MDQRGDWAADLFVHRRHRSGAGWSVARRGRHRGSCAPLHPGEDGWEVVRPDARCEGGVIAVDPRRVSYSEGLRVAGGVWRVHCEQVARGCGEDVHRGAARASSQGGLQVGVAADPAGARRGVR